MTGIRSGLFFLAFTDRGEALAERLAGSLGGSFARCGKGGEENSLAAWTEEHFPAAAGLVYVGAAGIAVRDRKSVV